MTAAICCRGTCISAVWPLMSSAPATRSIRTTYREGVLQNWNRWNICETFVKHLRHLWICVKENRNLEVTQFYSVLPNCLFHCLLMTSFGGQHQWSFAPQLKINETSVPSSLHLIDLHLVLPRSMTSVPGTLHLPSCSQSLLLYLHASVPRQRPCNPCIGRIHVGPSAQGFARNCALRPTRDSLDMFVDMFCIFVTSIDTSAPSLILHDSAAKNLDLTHFTAQSCLVRFVKKEQKQMDKISVIMCHWKAGKTLKEDLEVCSGLTTNFGCFS